MSNGTSKPGEARGDRALEDVLRVRRDLERRRKRLKEALPAPGSKDWDETSAVTVNFVGGYPVEKKEQSKSDPPASRLPAPVRGVGKVLRSIVGTFPPSWQPWIKLVLLIAFIAFGGYEWVSHPEFRGWVARALLLVDERPPQIGPEPVTSVP